MRVDNEDIREYSFTDRQRAVDMRKVLVGHIEQKLTKGNVKKLVGASS